jgi:hypothetical protein
MESALGIEGLPRAQDRVQKYTWGTVPLTWDASRFGAVETSKAEQPRRGWQVTLAEALQEEPGHVITWVLWREAFLGLLLPHVRQVPEVADLGLYAGLRCGGFSADEQEILKAVWERVSPPQHHVHYIYDAPYGFPLFDRVVDGAFLPRVVAWLNEIRASVVAPLTSASYTAALEQWMLETHVPLTANEVRILTVLANTTQFKQTELAQQLDMLPSALSPALTKLAQRHILRLYNFTNLPLVGLIPFEILMRVRDPKKRSKWVDSLSAMRYAYSITTMHHEWLLGRLFIPSGHVIDLQQWMEHLSTHEDIASASLSKVAALIDHWNFSTYTPGVGWIDDFSFIMEHARSIFTDQKSIIEDFTTKFSYNYEQENQQRLKLRPEDFIYFRRAIDTVFTTDRISPQLSKEIRETGLPDSAYRRRVQTLEELRISRLGRLWLLHIGLDTAIQLLFLNPQEMTTNFIQSLSIFPFISGAKYEHGNGRLRLFVPKLQGVEVLSFLQKLSIENELDILIEAKPCWKTATGLHYPLKETNYDFDSGEWKWDEKFLPKL